MDRGRSFTEGDSRLPVHKNRPFLIDTEGFKLPDFDPFDPSVSRYILIPPDVIDCNDGKRLLTKAVSNYKIQNGEYWNAIIIEENNIVDYNVNSFDCCYQTIKRNASGDTDFELRIPDARYNYSDATFYVEKLCQPMKTEITMVKADSVFVECSFNSVVFYRNAHMFVTLKPEHVTNKMGDTMGVDDRLNIMIFGIDSISRMNMQRYMPKVFQYMKDISAIDFRGFNKNYENTYPNLCAILSGVFPWGEEFYDKFNKMGRYFDYLPFLWKNFTNSDYVTVYGEDCSFLGTFAYKDKKGFKNVPTDYYFRPFLKAAEDEMGSNKGNIWITGCGLCSGCELNFQRILDYVKTVSTNLGKTKPYFSLCCGQHHLLTTNFILQVLPKNPYLNS
ncbi:hypothetical protein Avbf_16512 [Armadillidium vulgare]|nr:hypothetical protein Avbf_16512 [Armadillidium vulgare]